MAKCKTVLPSLSGRTTTHVPDVVCDSVHIDGADDTSIIQGGDIDLAEGVTAYDSDGSVIEFTYSPEEIDTCTVGRHTVTYTATGQGKRFLPSFCKSGLQVFMTACDWMKAEVTRIITVIQAALPTIRGIGDMDIATGTSIDPMSGVSATDAHGTSLEVTYDGEYDKYASGEIATFETNLARPAKSLTVTLEPIQEGSGTPSPDNVRPISGRTECVTERCGKNLADDSQFSIEQPSWYTGQYWLGLTDNGDGTYTETRPIGWGGYGFVYVGTFKSGTYFVSAELKDLASVTCAMNYIFKRKGTWDTVESYTNSSISSLGRYGASKTINEECDLWLVCAPYTSNGANVKFGNIQVEVGSTVTAYEPYSGTQYTTSFGRTVYGGTLDVVSGELTVDRAMVDLGTLNWTSYNLASNSFSALLSDGKVTGTNYSAEGNCSIYALADYITALRDGDKVFGVGYANLSTVVCYVAVRDTSYSDATAFKTAMQGVQLCYELATPQTYQLTPQEVQLLLGSNNVWSDGAVSVVYTEEMESGNITFSVPGNYEITYHATDKCGNTANVVRHILVGEKRTVLYTDGTLIINEAESDIQTNRTKHGAETNIYPPLDDTHNYVFGWNGSLWYAQRSNILAVEIGSIIQPTKMDWWFKDLTECLSIDLTNINTSQLTGGRGIFNGCHSLPSLDLSPLKDAKWTGFFDSMFYDCYVLTALDFTGFDTSRVVAMDAMFSSCYRLSSLNISSFDTSNVSDMQQMFSSCQSLESLDLSNFNTGRLKNTDSMFQYANHLTEIDLSSFDTSRVTKMSRMFFNCRYLETIDVSDSFVTDAVTDSHQMFENALSLVGGNGTTYSADHIDAEYARIDNPPTAPGYFTAK